VERNALSETNSQDASSPPRYRLSWDSRGLVLEERQSETDYAERASSAITFPPTPLAATHPELSKMVELTITQFKRGWLHDVETVSVAFSPPWGNAWKIPVGTMSGDDVKEMVEWELQQRLNDALQNHIYAWSRVNGDAYAIVIRPELLSFWEELIEAKGLELKSVTLKSGLVDAEIEEEADLLPLLHLWKERGGEEFVSDVPLIAIPDFTENGDQKKVVDSSVDEDEDFFSALYDKREIFSRLKLPMKLVIPILGVLLLLVVGWLFRGSILNVFTSDPTDQELIADAGNMETDVSATESVPAATEPAASVTMNTGISGSILSDLFTTADRNNIILMSVVLQGNEILVESEGDESSTSAWRTSMTASESIPVEAMESRGSSFGLSSLTLQSVQETGLTVTQFDRWVTSLGMTVQGRQLYSARQSMLNSLFTMMQQSSARPWRLSIHKAGPDSYLVMMLP
jgi:hypothetical protein